MAAEGSMFDPSVFANLQAKLDEETKIREVRPKVPKPNAF